MSMSLVLERQRSAPQYRERAAMLRSNLTDRHVSPDIVERVLRLNPRIEEGAELRGIHYSNHRDPRVWQDCTTKGDVIRRFGRDVWDRIPRSGIFKRGRRKYASRLEVQRAMS